MMNGFDTQNIMITNILDYIYYFAYEILFVLS